MGVARDAMGNYRICLATIHNNPREYLPSYFGSIISFGPHSLQSPWRIGVSKIVLGIHMEIEGDREGTLGIGVFFYCIRDLLHILIPTIYVLRGYNRFIARYTTCNF